MSQFEEETDSLKVLKSGMRSSDMKVEEESSKTLQDILHNYFIHEELLD